MKLNHLVVAATAILALPLMATNADAQGRGAALKVVADAGHPADISYGKTETGLAYTDSRGMTLYAMNLRFAGFFNGGQGGNPLKACTEDCAKSWIAVKAAADAKPVGSWKVVDGAQGPQWSYKGSPVFTYVGDHARGSAAGVGEFIFMLLNYIPPAPQIAAPAPVEAVFVNEPDVQAYVLEDGQGHALFTSNKSCGTDCRNWTPFGAGMASHSVGDWTISRDGDHTQWAYHGQLVYVSQEEKAAVAPAKGSVLTVAPGKVTALTAQKAPAKAAKEPARVAAQ